MGGNYKSSAVSIPITIFVLLADQHRSMPHPSKVPACWPVEIERKRPSIMSAREQVLVDHPGIQERGHGWPLGANNCKTPGASATDVEVAEQCPPAETLLDGDHWWSPCVFSPKEQQIATAGRPSLQPPRPSRDSQCRADTWSWRAKRLLICKIPWKIFLSICLQIL